MEISRNQLEEVIRQGITPDIFRMERAYALFHVIANHANTINQSQGESFGELFGALQEILVNEAISAAARLYDRPSKTFPTRCIRAVLDFLTIQAKDFPIIYDPYNLKLNLISLDVPSELQILADVEPARFSVALAEHYRSILDGDHVKKILSQVKLIRDKRLAHNEHTSVESDLVWKELQELMSHAKNLVGLLGWAYFNTAYVMDGEYLMANDAKRPAIALTSLFRKLYGKAAKLAEIQGKPSSE